MLVEAIRNRALRALRPPKREPLASWIQEHLRLPDSVSALPGKVKLWKPQVGICEAISDPGIERVTIVKPVRVGFSTLLTATIGNYVSNEPSPILALLPTEDDARGYMVDDIEPIFEATPSLAGLLTTSNDETRRSTLLSRKFPGGSLKIVPAKAPRNLRRHNVRILVEDEIDGMEVTNEGDPTTLAERRTLSFANRKIIKGSTPVYEDGPILRSYAQSDQRVFEVPCPECGAYFEIQWAHIKWEVDKPETAACECPHCKVLIPEKFKASMVAKAEWRATKPDVIGHAGFRLNALVSNLKNASWGKLAAEFVEAKRNPETLQVFVNTILAQGWQAGGEELDETGLAKRGEEFSLEAIPESVMYITAGVDVQDDRLEVSFLGFSKTEIFVLAHKVIWGNALDDTTWQDLDALLKSDWQHPLGGKLRLEAAIVDSGDGGVTDTVYAFCKPRFNRRVMAGKGVAGKRAIVQRSESKKAPLFIVAVDEAKSILFNRLASGNSIRFSKSLDAEYYSQLTSEKRRITYTRGQPVRSFVRKSGYRAEALDCFVYAFAAKHLLNVNLELRSAELKKEPLPTTGVRPGQVFRSKWLEGAR